MPANTPTQCPMCGRVMGGSSPIRVHHEQNHGLSLAVIAESEWPEHIAKNADRIENPQGITEKERALAPRHPTPEAMPPFPHDWDHRYLRFQPKPLT